LFFTKQFTAFFLSITLLLTSFPLQICYPYPILLNLKKLPKYCCYQRSDKKNLKANHNRNKVAEKDKTVVIKDLIKRI
ncbi:MAG: hypothetical protein ACOYU6_03330, partial [Bacteroidota bacterium]